MPAPPAGAHILSGNVLQPTALDELLPGWKDDEACPIRQPATASRFYYLTKGAALRLPNPPQMKHKGNYLISLRWGGGALQRLQMRRAGLHAATAAAVVRGRLQAGQLPRRPMQPPPLARPCARRCSEAVRWLGRKAEELGVEVFPGFAGARLAYGPAGDVLGVQVGAGRWRGCHESCCRMC